jgi:hypothetical protein
MKNCNVCTAAIGGPGAFAIGGSETCSYHAAQSRIRHCSECGWALDDDGACLACEAEGNARRERQRGYWRISESISPGDERRFCRRGEIAEDEESVFVRGHDPFVCDGCGEEVA